MMALVQVLKQNAQGFELTRRWQGLTAKAMCSGLLSLSKVGFRG